MDIETKYKAWLQTEKPALIEGQHYQLFFAKDRLYKAELHELRLIAIKGRVLVFDNGHGDNIVKMREEIAYHSMFKALYDRTTLG